MASDASKAELTDAMDTMIEEVRLKQHVGQLSVFLSTANTISLHGRTVQCRTPTAVPKGHYSKCATSSTFRLNVEVFSQVPVSNCMPPPPKLSFK